jgi:glycosyltransferase involved in cell wall biosynthesis
MRRDDGPLVSVILPAYNASATIERTLNSIVQQTYTHIEVLVVDDGSSDDTSAIVLRFAEADPRIRLIRKSNGGVASARNAAIAAARGEFVAPIDADDLWHPARVARHVETLLSSPADVGLVYSPFRLIDDDDCVIRSSYTFHITGWVLFRHLYVNVVGNASGMMLRRHVLAKTGTYQSWLRELKAEGCEDFLLQLIIAMHYRFIVVPEFLIGYRVMPGSISSDSVRMMRSQILVLDAVAVRCTALPTTPFRLVRLKHRISLLIELLRSRRYQDLFSEFNLVQNPDPSLIILVALFAFTVVCRAGRWCFHRALHAITRKGATPRHFSEFTADESPGPRLPPTMALWLAVLWLFDRHCADADGYAGRYMDSAK